MAVYSTCFFYYSVARVFLQRCLATASVHDCRDVAAQNVSALKEKTVRFSNCRENQANGDSTRTKQK